MNSARITSRFRFLPVAVLAATALMCSVPHADEPATSGRESAQSAETQLLTSVEPERRAAARRGYELLRTKAFNPPDFDQEVFENLWKVWPEPLRSQARDATPQQRRKLAFGRYGLIEDPANPDADGPGLGYASAGQGRWSMSCLACHAGKVAGQIIPGLPNSHFAMQTLTEDVRLVKLSMRKKLSHLDLGMLTIPLGGSVGTTNSVVFGVVLDALRDPDMNFVPTRPVPELLHHDMDAPPWWNVSRKDRLYIDGFSPRNHRILMQFILTGGNDREQILEWEDEFRDILAWIESLEPPKYPFEINRTLARQGEAVFRRNCSRCHGTYGDDARYEPEVTPIEELGTDPVRLRALTPAGRAAMLKSWMSYYGRDRVDVDPGGYMAPPLDGIWASGPYFHNGSVPTLWHVLHPDQRPAVWRRTDDEYDQSRLGLRIETFSKFPAKVTDRAARRTFFDTSLPGKSAAGHRFPDLLTEDEKRAVLEYLKTL